MKTLCTVLLLTVALVSQAPSPQTRVAGVYVAANYGQWHVALKQGNTVTGSQPIVVSTGQVTLTDGATITPFAANERIFVGKEQVTITSTTCTSAASCQIVATFTATHANGQTVTPASYGLDEAANEAFAGNGGTGGVVVIDNAWAALGGTYNILLGANAQPNVVILDNRGTLQQQYCYGTGVYTPCGGGGGGGGTGSVTSGGMTPNTIPVATDVQAINNSLLTDASGTLSYTGLNGLVLAGGTGASYIGLGQGVSQATQTATIGLTAPSSVTAYNLTLPGAACASGQTWTFANSTGTLQCTTAAGAGNVTTTGSPAATYLASFSGPTAITGTIDGIFNAGALSLGANGTSGGLINLRGASAGFISATANTTGTTLTLAGNLGQLAIPAGTVGTPALSFGGDATSGWYRPTVGTTGFSVSGVQQFNVGSLFFAAAIGTIYRGIATSGTITYSSGIDGVAGAGNRGAVAIRGADTTSGNTSGDTAGMTNIRGGDQLATGATETAGDVTIRTGHVTSATPTVQHNGRILIDWSAPKSATYNAGNLACITASSGAAGYLGTVGDCATAANNIQWVGVLITLDGNAAVFRTMGVVNINSTASTVWTAGDLVCTDGTNAAVAVDNGSTACPSGTKVGVVYLTDGAATNSHSIFLTR